MLTVLLVRGVERTFCNETSPTLKRSLYSSKVHLNEHFVVFGGLVFACFDVPCSNREDHRGGERGLSVNHMLKHVLPERQA
jgi:hypothetical protein